MTQRETVVSALRSRAPSRCGVAGRLIGRDGRPYPRVLGGQRAELRGGKCRAWQEERLVVRAAWMSLVDRATASADSSLCVVVRPVAVAAMCCLACGELVFELSTCEELGSVAAG
jgi:hypothetical protein